MVHHQNKNTLLGAGCCGCRPVCIGRRDSDRSDVRAYRQPHNYSARRAGRYWLYLYKGANKKMKCFVQPDRK